MSDKSSKPSITSKWKSAFKSLKSKGLAPPHSHKEKSPAEIEGRPRSASTVSASQELEGDIDPTYLLLKQASSYYKKKHEDEIAKGKEPETSQPAVHRKTSVPAVVIREVGGSAARQPVKYIGSKSNAVLKVQNSVDSVDSNNSDDNQPLKSLSTRPRPKLNNAMKSVSLDTPDLEPTKNGKLTKSYSKDKRFLQSKIWNSSLETSDETRSEKSSPSCSQSGSTQSLSTVYVVTHSNAARINEELELVKGDRVTVTSTCDRDWWHGYKQGDLSHRIGVFPSTCVGAMLPGERPMQLAHNLNLTSVNKILRLYRDQVIFVSAEQNSEGMVLIRTDKHYKAFCPPAALHPLLP